MVALHQEVRSICGADRRVGYSVRSTPYGVYCVFYVNADGTAFERLIADWMDANILARSVSDISVLACPNTLMPRYHCIKSIQW